MEVDEAQPTAGGALSNADPETEYEHLVPEVSLAAPSAEVAFDEVAFDEVALAPTEPVDVGAEPAEIATALELASCETDDTEVPALEDTRTRPSVEAVSPCIAAKNAAPEDKGQSVAGKKKKNALGSFLPKLLGWDKEEKIKPPARGAHVEHATQAAGGEEAVGIPPVSTSAEDLEGKETVAQGGNLVLDVSNSATGGTMMETKRLPHEAEDRDQLIALSTAPVDLEGPTPTKNHNGGFSIPKLFGWVKQDKTRSRGASVETATPQMMDEILSEGMENPLVDDEFSIAAAMMSAEGVSEAIEVVSGSTRAAADARALGDVVEDAELAATREPDHTEVSSVQILTHI